MDIVSDCRYQARVAELLVRFEGSPERAALGPRRIRFVRPFLQMLYDITEDPEPPVLLDDFAREIIPELPRWCGGSPVPGDAERMLAELRAFYACAHRLRMLPHAGRWCRILRGDYVEVLREGIARERRRAERRRRRRLRR